MEMGVVQDSGNDRVLSSALLSCQMPSVAEGQTHVDAALGARCDPHPRPGVTAPDKALAGALLQLHQLKPISAV